MRFIVRSVVEEDYEDILALAKQFTLMNLPADSKLLKQKIQCSIRSFAGKLEKEKAEYLFALEDLEVDRVIGTSLIIAKHGTAKHPHTFYKILERKLQSATLKVRLVHKVLRLDEDTNGPTQIGGLILDRSYRRRSEKLGRLLSLSRFIYIGMKPQMFESEILCEFSPLLNDEGNSEFWEALGRRFTGLSYAEANRLRHLHKNIIKTLFPEEDIYVCLIDPIARVTVGAVGEESRGAKRVLEKIGFTYRQEVDLFDGGPHYSCKLKNVSLIKNGAMKTIQTESKTFSQDVLLGFQEHGRFYCVHTSASIFEDIISLNMTGYPNLKNFSGKKVFCAAL